MKILNENQIRQKITRLAIEILEHNYDASKIILAGINRNGVHFAKLLYGTLTKMTSIPIEQCQIVLNPANPLETPITISASTETLAGTRIIIADDVANTGRTIFYALQPLMNLLPDKVEVAVLVDRQHKSFPIKVDYVGLSLATTLKENIDVRIRDVKEMEVHLL